MAKIKRVLSKIKVYSINRDATIKTGKRKMLMLSIIVEE